MVSESNHVLNRSLNKKKLKADFFEPSKKLNALISNNPSLNGPNISNLKEPQSNSNLFNSGLLSN
jgi:hypothetical protein